MANRTIFAIAVIVIAIAIALVEARNFHAAGNPPPRQWAIPPRPQGNKGPIMANPFLKRLEQMVYSPDLYQQQMELEKYPFHNAFADEEEDEGKAENTA